MVMTFFLIRDFFERNLFKIRIVLNPAHLDDSLIIIRKKISLQLLYLYGLFSTYLLAELSLNVIFFCISPVPLRQYYKNITCIFWILGLGSGIESYSTA